MKKLCCLLLAALAVLSLSSCALIPAKINGMSYELDDAGAVITGYTDKTTVTTLTVPDEIEGRPVYKIADFGLCNAESLTEITIGKNVKEIESWALTNNQHLQRYVVSPENTYFKTDDQGALFSADGKTLISYPAGRNITFDRFGQAQNDTTYAIPDGVEVIASKAFYKCYYVDVNAFPDSIRRIEEKAFHKTSLLKDFKMPASLEYIGKDAFAYDELLTELTIPATIKEIGEYAFFNCKNMKKLTVLAKESDIKLENKWQPTFKGKIMDECEVVFAG